MLRYTVESAIRIQFKSFRLFSLFRFPLPDLGQKIKQGRVKKLYVKQGDKVQQFQKIADVQSDKQFTEITSPQAGLIKKLHYRQDEICQVGNLFMEIDTTAQNQNNNQKKQSVKPKKQAVSESKIESVLNDDFLASATVKMYARQHKINLKDVKGTGRKGRILKEDILHAIQNHKKLKSLEGQSKKLQHTTVEKAPIISPIHSKNKPIQVIKMNQQDKLLYKLMSESNKIPHLFYQQSFDVSQLQKMSKMLEEKHKKKISLLSLLLKCFSRALIQFPKMNSTYNVSQPFKYRINSQQNVIIPNFNSKSVFDLRLINRLEKMSVNNIQAALDHIQSQKTLTQAQIHKGSICVSHIGSFGSLAMNPTIIGQTTCHASIGSIKETPVFVNGSPIKKSMVQVTMGCDHRVLDGATVARFTTTWRSYSQNSALVFLDMI